MKRLLTFSSAVLVLLSIMCICVFSKSEPVFEMGEVLAESGASVRVPLTLTGNSLGICGATLTVGYDENLTLTKIEQGEALSGLTLTKPGTLNENPVNIVWDGMEADTSNGVVCYLTFTAPTSGGTYPISLSYVEGDILDGNISSIDVIVKSGCIKVSEEATDESGIIMKADTVMADSGESVKLPIMLSGNTGICGATVTVKYADELVLTAVNNGEALSGLTLTKPGKLTENPVNIVWDGMEADTSNGAICYLTFTAPTKDGTYPIEISYVEGDILDGNVEILEVKMVSGAIIVGDCKEVKVQAFGKTITLTNDTNICGTILVASYDTEGRLLGIIPYEPTAGISIGNPDSKVTSLKFMWWESMASVRSLCNAEEITK